MAVTVFLLACSVYVTASYVINIYNEEERPKDWGTPDRTSDLGDETESMLCAITEITETKEGGMDKETNLDRRGL